MAELCNVLEQRGNGGTPLVMMACEGIASPVDKTVHQRSCISVSEADFQSQVTSMLVCLSNGALSAPGTGTASMAHAVTEQAAEESSAAATTECTL
jgi:hypothetical protein